MQNIIEFIEELQMKAEQSTGNAVDLLKADHKKVDMLFKKFEKSENASDKQVLVDTIVKELSIHATVEEQLVYPIVDEEDHECAGEAVEEHHVVKLLLAEIADMRVSDDKMDAKMSVLCELVKHHVKEEEHELLPKLKQTGTDLEELGENIAQRKKRLMASMKKVGNKTGKQIGGSPRKSQDRSRSRKAS